MKRFNLEEFINFFIFLGFSIFLNYLLSTNKIGSFINPKMLRYIYLSFISFSALTIYQFTKIFTIPTTKPLSFGCVILSLGLLLGIIASRSGLNGDIINKKGINVVKANTEVNAYEILMNIDNITNLDDIINVNSNLKNIELNENNYVKVLNDIGKNVGKYKGKKIKLRGFVYKDNTKAGNEFILSRLVMTCCAADSQAIGIKSLWQGTLSLNNDDWVEVEGNIDLSQDGISPIIKIERLEKIKRPDNIYVYE